MKRLRPFRKAFLLYGVAAGCAAAAGYINGTTDVAMALTGIAIGLIALYVWLGA